VNPEVPNEDTKFLGPEALRGSGGILLNSKVPNQFDINLFQFLCLLKIYGFVVHRLLMLRRVSASRMS